ncbi:hypothetical protein BDV97DRAFT_397882 [Delphinella strobiligena]|nr:hypothetical protein BDV97DRAFT_397882 [Delphinella strobiligena]
MNGHTTLLDFHEKLEAFRRFDSERDALIQGILRKCEDLEEQLNNKSDDYENELAGRRMWQAQARRCQSDLQDAQMPSDTNPFVLVLIDGDGAIFHDHLYKGADGGAEAAYNLLVDIKTHLNQLYPDVNTSNWSIMVQYYYNMEGLSHKLRALGVLKNPNEMAPFARAFGLNQPLFNFIDVGSGKERADYKVRETLRLFLPNIQCKHVVFGGCHDNGYLPALDPYKRDPKLASRISLLETLPIQPGFAQLGYRVVQFPSVFRSEPLPERPGLMTTPQVSQSTTGAQQSLPLRTPCLASGGAGGGASSVLSPKVQSVVQGASPSFTSRSSSPSPSVDSTAASSWATVGKATPGQKSINIAPKRSVNRKNIILNQYDERLDADLPKADTSAQQRLFERTKKRKVCNSYHLRGKCEAGQYCDYDHGERLSPGEQLALKHRARTRSCPDKSGCRDFDCTNGHVCPYGTACYNDGCWFQDVHDIDLEPVSRVYENGEKEWLKNFLE